LTESIERGARVAACRGKTALVTNATHAPGNTAAISLADAGAQVLIHEERSSPHAQAIVEEAREVGGIAKAIAVDTSAAEGLQRLARQTHTVVGDRLDILVLNVAATARRSTLLMALLLPILCRRSSVIFMYPVGTALGIEMTQVASLLQPRGVRVNAIEVSRVSSTRRGLSAASAQRHFSALGTTITYLASNESREITGTTLHPKLRAGTGIARAAASAASRDGAR
jgi:3-oxoacyl-[acyl-carrier protein] reductase